MNAGGLATVQPIAQTAIPQERTTPHQHVKRMTYDGETLSAASLELRARFAGSIEKMKVIAERAKQRQDAARPALIKREREDQQKYHRRVSLRTFQMRNFKIKAFHPRSYIQKNYKLA
ncbi:unnamed protein product [Toxocara canis]|uniref:Uncharacterized protein n=1 Tax=Toxocara canis TaxID=6265 RepID=A0A183TXZ7_TOXCA|nr:unnamed protein product [Toxocara canis]